MSKGSHCNDVGQPDTGDGSGNCNLTRTAAAEALVNWLASDPTGSGDDDFLVNGDLNSYDKEDPIDALLAGGYTDLVRAFEGEFAYAFVFDGQLGYLDYALAGQRIGRRGHGRDGMAHQRGRTRHPRLRHHVQAAGPGRPLRAERVPLVRPRRGDRRPRQLRRDRADARGVGDAESSLAAQPQLRGG
jgi:hypothetical protein